MWHWCLVKLLLFVVSVQKPGLPTKYWINDESGFAGVKVKRHFPKWVSLRHFIESVCFDPVILTQFSFVKSMQNLGLFCMKLSVCFKEQVSDWWPASDQLVSSGSHFTTIQCCTPLFLFYQWGIAVWEIVHKHSLSKSWHCQNYNDMSSLV